MAKPSTPMQYIVEKQLKLFRCLNFAHLSKVNISGLFAELNKIKSAPNQNNGYLKVLYSVR